MDAIVPNKPKTMAELLPGLRGILSKDAMQTLTSKKQPRSTITATRTTEKVLKPMTIAEMRADIQALKVPSPKLANGTTSTKKRWNSSVKLENKTVSHTAQGQMKHNPVRKVLNFQQPKPKIPKMSTISNARMTMTTETPKFPRPEYKARKSIYQQARTAVRISGVYQLSETPLLMNKPTKNQMTLAKKEATPKSFRKQVMASRIPDTPISNESWKSSCDDSFLQNEKNIEFIEAKTKALSEESTLENIAEVSPPVSTPFNKYRNVKEFFNNSSDLMENSSTAYHDNTIMCFDKPSVSIENSKREETVIVSLCDMLNKATVSNSDSAETSTELDGLLQIEKQTENNLKMIENGINTLNCIKETQLKSLKYVRKLIKQKQKERTSESEKDKTVIEAAKNIPKIQNLTTPIKSPVVSKPCSVIKSCLKSPSYKIPKKNQSSLRKKVIYKSLPNVANQKVTPPRNMGSKALSMYMEMKENMYFLSTPVVKQHPTGVLDTPAVTSHNLQMQLDKLYES